MQTAISVWAIYWLIPFLLFLPVQRFIAEAAKHIYKGTDSVFEATVSNIGCFHEWVLHPHSDGYHLLHHIDPNVPHHKLKATHEELVRLDPEGYGAYHRHRTRVLEDAKTAAPLPLDRSNAAPSKIKITNKFLSVRSPISS